jgi:hypothetical protein
MDSKFGKSVKAPTFQLEQGAELECWNRFIRRFEIAIIGAGLKQVQVEEGKKEKSGNSTEGKKRELEQRKAALLLDSMGDIGMDIFE